MKRTAIILLVGISLASCITPVLTKRYKKAEFCTLQPEDVKKYVTVEVASFPVTAKAPQDKGILDLSDRGQQAFINALSEKEKDADKLISKIALPFEGKQPKAINERPKYKRQLVFSVDHRINNSANRIDSIKLTLILQTPATIRLSAWDRIVTNYQIIDIGKLTLGEKSSFAISPELAIDKVASAKIGSLSYEKSLQEEVGIKDRIVISGTLTNERAILFEQGVSGMDLKGNLIAEVELEATDIGEIALFKFDNIFKKTGEPEKDSNNIDISESVASYPNIQGDIKGDLEYEFVFREVRKGEKTYLEGDDNVVFQRGKGKVDNIPLITVTEFANKTWRIHDGTNVLHIFFKERNKSTVINFASADDARTFLRWLKILRPSAIKGNEIRIGPDKHITNGDIDKLDIKILQTPQEGIE